MPHEKYLNIRLPNGEFDLLAGYAVATGRSKTEIVREFIRSLELKLPSEAKPKKARAKS